MSELLAKLTAKGVPITADLIGGGIPAVTWDMVAASLRGMNRHVYLLARVKFAFDGTCLNELYRENRHIAEHMAAVQRWQIEPAVVRKIADLALRENITGRLCGHCNGAGRHNNQKTCAKCGGTGLGAGIPAQAKARYCGIPEWKRKHQSAFEGIGSDLDGLMASVHGMVARKMGLYEKTG